MLRAMRAAFAATRWVKLVLVLFAIPLKLVADHARFYWSSNLERKHFIAAGIPEQTSEFFACSDSRYQHQFDSHFAN
eukprot:6472794-Amphidinium_carterae.2